MALWRSCWIHISSLSFSGDFPPCAKRSQSENGGPRKWMRSAPLATLRLVPRNALRLTLSQFLYSFSFFFLFHEWATLRSCGVLPIHWRGRTAALSRSDTHFVRKAAVRKKRQRQLPSFFFLGIPQRYKHDCNAENKKKRWDQSCLCSFLCSFSLALTGWIHRSFVTLPAWVPIRKC